MSTDREEDKIEHVVEVKAEKLFEVVKALVAIDANMQAEALKKFGEVIVTLPLQDAQAIKSFIDAARTEGASPARDRLAAAVPRDFGHCTTRRRLRA